MEKLSDLLEMAKVSDIIATKKEKEDNKIVWALAIIGAIAAVAGIAFAVYKYLTPDYMDDFDEDDDDSDDDDSDDDDMITDIGDMEFSTEVPAGGADSSFDVSSIRNIKLDIDAAEITVKEDTCRLKARQREILFL